MVQIRLLGPVEVAVDEESRPVPGLRRRAVLAVLALRRGEVVSTDRLVEAVWGDAAPPTVGNTLQRHVSHLRLVLGDKAAIVARAPGYVLAAEAQPTDVEIAERLVRQGTSSTDDTQRVRQLRAALALWRGPSLVDVAGLPWLAEQALRLDRLRLRGRRALAEARLALGEHTQLVPELEELTGEHPDEEPLHALLMLALYRAGRQADALAAYHRLRATLRDELGIVPSQTLRDLATAILRQDPDLIPAWSPLAESAAAAPLPASAMAAPGPAQLPTAVRAFAGRGVELAALDAVLARAVAAGGPGAVISVVSGSAGIGKTTLAVYWAHRVAARFPDGQLYVNLRGFGPGGSVLDPAEAIRGFLDAFEVPVARVPVGLDAQAALYRSLLAGKRVLVVLDNARDVEQVRPLLPGSPGCLVVVTSRDQLTSLVAAEGAHLVTLDLLSDAEAGDLLGRRLGADRVAAEPAAVDEIVARCARLPLALGIAAARAATRPGFPLATLAGQLRAAAGGLGAFDGGDPTTDVRAVLSWSYRALSVGTARLFRLLGLHPGPDAGAPALASLAGLPLPQVQPLIAELVRSNLLAEPAPGRYACHDLLRAYAAELVASQDDPDAAQHRLLDHYLHTAQTVTRLLYGPWNQLPLAPAQPGVTPEQPTEPSQANAWFTAEQHVLLAAIHQAAATGFEAYAWRLAWSSTLVFQARGLWHEWAAAQQVALLATECAADEVGQAYAHDGLGRAYSWLGRDDDAFAHLQQALDRFTALGDKVAQANVRLGLGFLYDRKGDAHEARDQSQEALELFRSAGHRSGQAIALNNIGWSLTQLGDYPTALWHCQQSLGLHRELQEIQGMAGSWDSLGLIHHHLGDHKQAVSCYTAALNHYRQLEDRYNEASTRTRLGDAHEASGNLDAAHGAWQSALTILDELRHPDAEPLRFKIHHRVPTPADPRG